MKENLDETDYKILRILMDDAKLSYQEIGEKVNLSQGAVHARVKKLENAGIITGSTIRLDVKKLGWDVSAFIGIHLEKPEYYELAKTELMNIAEVVSVNYTTGNYSIFAKLICRDTSHLKSVLGERIQKLPGIQRTETTISLEEPLNRTAPLI